MKHSSQHPTTPSPDRLVLYKPVGWLTAALAVALVGLMIWRHSARQPETDSALQNPVAGTEQSSEEGLATRADSKAMMVNNQSAPSGSSSPKTIGHNAELGVDDLVRQLNSDKLAKAERRRVAMALARSGTDTAIQAMKAALESGSPELQEIIADALGHCSHVETGAILESQLSNTNERVVMAAIRSLGRQGSALAVASLGQLLNDDQQSVDARAEAAAGLGMITRPEALAALARATAQIRDEAVASAVLRSIAGRPVEETSAFLQAFLAAPHISADLKTEALEGLSEAKGEATPLLLNYVKDNNPELRAAAAWALSTLETPGNAGPEILALLGDETDPLVRKRLYQALDNQETFDLNAAWTLATQERDPTARVAALDLFAGAVEQTPSGAMVSFFDQHVLPELKNAALNGQTKDERLASVIALRRAGTENANAALRAIFAQTTDRGVAAATGLTPQVNLRR